MTSEGGNQSAGDGAGVARPVPAAVDREAGGVAQDGLVGEGVAADGEDRPSMRLALAVAASGMALVVAAGLFLARAILGPYDAGVMPPAEVAAHTPAPAEANEAPGRDLAAGGRLPPIAPGRLRIASWHLGDAARVGALAAAEPAGGPAWRHTFGAERRLAKVREEDGGRLDADVVLLQGIVSVRDVRLMFPARGWRLILSREILRAERDASGETDRLRPERAPAVAIAIRHQRTVKITLIEHPLRGNPPGGAAGAAGPVPAVAVRLVHERGQAWLMSADLSGACPRSAEAAGATCAERLAAYPALVAYLEGRAEDAVIAGGVLSGGEASAQTAPAQAATSSGTAVVERDRCGEQTLLARPGDLGTTGAAGRVACVLYLDL
ncbi:MAG: hypothetical protein NW205_14215 [Hyphomicrobiaceae bacterium]|nr:hypothetical protein [Hyphomicrobiaceae bacterium]